MIAVLEDIPDRLIIDLDPGGPVELTGLTESFAALARMYSRHYRSHGESEPAPRLYVTRLEAHDGARHTLLECSFDENELNRAAVNIDQALSGGDDALMLTDDVEASELPSGAVLREVMLFFEQASRKPGRVRGRTGDRGI